LTPRSAIERMLADRLDFLIGVGHDMRAPLTAIAGFATVLAELESVAADATAAEAVSYIRREATALVEMLNALLDFGSVEQGAPLLDLEPLDLGRVARLATESWARLHPELTFQVVSRGEVVIDGDFLKLHRVLANLIENAVHHSPPGGAIIIEVGRENGTATLTVIDQGEGVAEADRERIFERFVRVNGGGAGIGLYVVKGLVTAHGGTVAVAGGPGGRFVVRLPVRAAVALPFEDDAAVPLA
jgi:signal transduction histidine kinase